MVLVGDGDGFLDAGVLEVCVVDLEVDARSEAVIAAELEGNFFGRIGEFGMEKGQIGGFILEGVFGADRFLFVEGHER